jgi:hypothetical protein
MSSDSAETLTDENIKALSIAQQHREYFHRALWEEEKHFTWLLSIILAAQITIITMKCLPTKEVLLCALAAIGFIFAVIALRVVRREGKSFMKANKLFVECFNIVFPEHKIKPPADEANRDIIKLPCSVLGYKPPSIRDCFQFIFLVFAVADILLFAATLIGWL